MKTIVRRNGDTLVVALEGQLSFEDQGTLTEQLKTIVQTRTDSSPRKIIFNLEKLDFVGSSGISSFVKTLSDIQSTQAIKPRYCNVKSEFQRIMKSLAPECLDASQVTLPETDEIFSFYENEDRAKKSFDN